MATLDMILRYFGGVSGAAWILGIPGFMFSHRNRLGVMAKQVEDLVKEVRDLKSEAVK